MLIRNDDVHFSTPLSEIQRFCELCDRYGFQALHAITPIGSELWNVDCRWDNERIRRETGTALFSENRPVVQYLRDRKDYIAVHGLWHTHAPSLNEIQAGDSLINDTDLWPYFFVPPFNEGNYSEWFEPDVGYYIPDTGRLPGIIVSGPDAPRLEEYLDRPEDLVPHLLPDGSIDVTLHSAVVPEIVYLHSWRFERGPFTWEQLDRCLAALSTRLCSSESSEVSLPR